jgi:hypothetical protein
VSKLLDGVAANAASAAGLRAAAAQLDAGQSAGAEKKWAGSGTPPWAALRHDGGVAVLVAIARRACGDGGDVDLAKAAAEVPIPAFYNSGGVDKLRADEDRRAVEGAAKCGPVNPPL